MDSLRLLAVVLLGSIVNANRGSHLFLCPLVIDSYAKNYQSMGIKSEEVNYKKNFCEKYFDKGTWDLDVLNQVDILLKDKKENALLYIESKFQIKNESSRRSALAQTILTNKKQNAILSKVALIYQDEQNNDILEFIDCSDNSVMYNNDINWKSEKPSNPTKDAIDRINDRIADKIRKYKNDEIREFYRLLKKGGDTEFQITEKNFNVVYNEWKNEIKFKEEIKDEQDIINLFLVDILNGTKYKKSFFADMEENTIFGKVKTGEQEVDTEQDLIREGTNLSYYKIMYDAGKVDGIKYSGRTSSAYYTIDDGEKYAFFWKKYKRPPEKNEFLKILERSATLYSDKYRRDTGGEYTPSCFVEKQNEILRQHYNLDEFIVCDPCAGVGNLENQFGIDFKQFCYLSTLEQMDVDTCKIKGFDNAIQYDYLKNNEQPKWKYMGVELDINEICQREHRKLMVVMNPPYQRVKGKKNNLAIEFFNKVLQLKPQVIVFYYMTESFLRSEIEQYIASGYKIVSHIFSNAKTTFKLSEWSISQVIFDKDKGEEIDKKAIKADRYELEKDDFVFKGTYTYNTLKPSLIDEIDKKIKENRNGMVLGNVSYLDAVINLTNKLSKNTNVLTTDNILYCLLSKGINFNTHNHYFERNNIVLRGEIEDIQEELFNDSIMFSMFYLRMAFTNKGQKNYIMPFTSEELGCAKNDLNVLFPQDNNVLFTDEANEKPFDFREFLNQFTFSAEAKALYNAALKIFRYYHSREEFAKKRDWNDSFYDITNAIMGKDALSFKELETDKDTRINKTKTTKGTKGFGQKNIKSVVPSESLPIFTDFFDARDVLARKINRQLVESGLLLWERENIY